MLVVSSKKGLSTCHLTPHGGGGRVKAAESSPCHSIPISMSKFRSWEEEGSEYDIIRLNWVVNSYRKTQEIWSTPPPSQETNIQHKNERIQKLAFGQKIQIFEVKWQFIHTNWAFYGLFRRFETQNFHDFWIIFLVAIGSIFPIYFWKSNQFSS